MNRLTRWIKDISQAKFFDIQNVSDYFWTNKNEYSDLCDMNLAPPFSFFATRYTMPEKVYSEERGWNDQPNAGTEIITVFRALEEALPAIQMKWFYDIMLFAIRGRKVNPVARWTMAVDELGRVARQPDGHAAFWITTIPGESPPPHLVSYLHVSGLALTFLHCRNVEVLPAYPDKKRKARKRSFEVRWHRLKVSAVGQKREGVGSGESTGIKQSLHIVRGHFKGYGPEYGKGLLFGKYAGRFWVASHFKGDPETGIVSKDYEVDSPEIDQ